MEREAIERLSIDSAAGDLNEDTEALLGTYLAEHPQANKWAEDVRQIYDKTEAAIRTKTAHADVGKVTPGITPVSQVKWLSVARWAAAIALGIIIGFTAGRRNQTDSTYRIAFQELSRYPKQVETVSDLKERYAGTFWGDKMLALLEHKPGQRYKTNLRSVGSWDKYRQYIKEKQNE
ncbi:MAG TPA: hypothetical protein VMX36_15040 [Sedimentisphaerales bacterium]|nr:hypothetical protein [Sedimentisphaerales bacterium]